MKSNLKKIICVVFCFVFLGMTFVAPVAQASFVYGTNKGTAESSAVQKWFYNLADSAINKIVGGINNVIPDPDWDTAEEYKSEGIMTGTEEFLTEPSENAHWSIGYSNASILTGDELDGNHCVTGTLAVTERFATEVYDDLKVRTIAMSDNSGRGIVVFAVIDSYGMSNTDVRAIRLELEEYCKANNVVSLNISVMHQHSAVDTMGLNGSMLKALFLNPARNLFGMDPINGKNESYMKNLYKVVGQSVKNAVADMKDGSLYFGTVDNSKYVTDKRDPQILDPNFDRFRFVPADGSRETWFTTSSIHCVANGVSGTQITGDYPYYTEKVVNEDYDANFMFILDAEQGTSQDKSTVIPEGSTLTTPEELTLYGKALADTINSINNETEVAPLLNIRNKEVTYNIDNQILVLAGKCGLATNGVIKDSGKCTVVTEIGYMEIGNDIAVAMIPGEPAAELFYGGFLTSADSWTGTDWTLPTVQSMTGSRKLIVFAITNDQIGYIVPDNDYMSILAPEGKSLEVVSLGSKTASTLVKQFDELIKSVK